MPIIPSTEIQVTDEQMESVIKRFWKYIQKGPECWEWVGAKTKAGYGLLTVPVQKQIYMHRFSYVLHKGKFPKKLLVCHRCDNPCCVNPEHLFLGTKADNSLDMVAKNRDGKPSKILSAEQVIQIRRDYKPWVVSQSMLAKKYGVSSGCIQGIVDGVTWRRF